MHEIELRVRRTNRPVLADIPHDQLERLALREEDLELRFEMRVVKNEKPQGIFGFCSMSETSFNWLPTQRPTDLNRASGATVMVRSRLYQRKYLRRW